MSPKPRSPLAWPRGDTEWRAREMDVYAQRDTTSSTGDLLVNLGDTASYVNVFHGGRRIEVFDHNFFTHAFRYVSPGTWQATTDTAVTPPRGTFWSLLWWSHDRDSVADIIFSPGGASATLDVGFRTGTSERRSLGVITVPLANPDTTCAALSPAWTDSTTSPPTFHPAQCFHYATNGTVETMAWATAFGLTGGQIFVAVSKFQQSLQSLDSFSPCPWDPDPTGSNAELCRGASFLYSTEGTDVWSVPTSATGPRLLWSFPSPKEVFWLAGSEDGSQVVTGEGQSQATVRLTRGQVLVEDPPTFSGCGVGYRRATSGADATPMVPTPSVCLAGGQGQGTISPAPPRSGPCVNAD